MEERLVLDAAVPRRSADDPELERPVGDALDDGLRVEDAERDVQLPGAAAANSHRSCDSTHAARPGRRADLEACPSSSPVASSASSLTISLLEREQPLGADR